MNQIIQKKSKLKPSMNLDLLISENCTKIYKIRWVFFELCTYIQKMGSIITASSSAGLIYASKPSRE